MTAIVLAGAVAGAAAFARSLGGGADSGVFGVDALPPAPASPLVVQATARPPVVHDFVVPASPLQRLTVHAIAVHPSTVVAHARPIVVAAIPHPSAHPDEPLPVKTGKAAPPAPAAPAAPTAPAPVSTPAAPVAPPAAAPAPVVRVVASVAPVAAPAAPVQPSERDHGHDRGHAFGKSKDKGKHGDDERDHSDQQAQLVLVAAPIDPSAAPTPVEAPPADTVVDPPAAADASDVPDGGDADSGHHGHGHGHSHDNGGDDSDG